MPAQRVFVTGASGYVGSAVAARLVRAGHEVYGLTRRRDHARALAAVGVHPVLGDLAGAADWLGALQNCDAAVHAASDDTGPAARDQNALEALRAAALDGRVRRVIYTSGVWVNGAGDPGVVVDESTPVRPLELVQWRVAHEEIALDLASHDVAVVVLRPGIVYGECRGILGAWFAEAHEHHALHYPGDGAQHWPLVHRDDLAEAYALALEHASGGERFVLGDESRHRVKELAEAAAAAAGVPAGPTPAAEVIGSLALYGRALLADMTVTSAKARRELGWVARHTSFVAEAPALLREWTLAREAPVA